MLGLNSVTGNILNNALSGGGGSEPITPAGTGFGKDLLKNIFGTNTSEIPEVQTVKPVDNTGTYIAVALIVIIAFVFIYYISFKKN